MSSILTIDLLFIDKDYKFSSRALHLPAGNWANVNALITTLESLSESLLYVSMYLSFFTIITQKLKDEVIHGEIPSEIMNNIFGYQITNINLDTITDMIDLIIWKRKKKLRWNCLTEPSTTELNALHHQNPMMMEQRWRKQQLDLCWKLLGE